ncbi:MAG: UDP-N-acetylmuramate dehydrogenase [Candidatus Omnitrophica bacterium]|nr:UDP-N-acetylmuramate dehydrogenase [Candidatus Omnitrophota bacterium]
MTLLGALKIGLEPDELLSRHTSWRIGGHAIFFARPKNTEELTGILEFARCERLPFYVLGRGSNVLFPDEGYGGVVINMLEFKKDFMCAHEAVAEVSAGMPNNQFVQKCAEHNLGGVEFLSSIPGTLGGAVVQNAGFSRRRGVINEIGNFVEEVTVLTPEGRMRTLQKSEINFSYRDSNLRQYVIVKIKLKMISCPQKQVLAEVHENSKYRNDVQDLQHPSAGSVFKNPQAPSPSSGRLIDLAGLRGYRIGDAQISPRHANFFINLGQATCRDMLELIALAKDKVKQKFGVKLEEEIRYVPG